MPVRRSVQRCVEALHATSPKLLFADIDRSQSLSAAQDCPTGQRGQLECNPPQPESEVDLRCACRETRGGMFSRRAPAHAAFLTRFAHGSLVNMRAGRWTGRNIAEIAPATTKRTPNRLGNVTLAVAHRRARCPEVSRSGERGSAAAAMFPFSSDGTREDREGVSAVCRFVVPTAGNF